MIPIAASPGANNSNQPLGISDLISRSIMHPPLQSLIQVYIGIDEACFSSQAKWGRPLVV